MTKQSTIDVAEVEKFSAMADQWWDETGDFRPLHQINPIRISYIKDQINKVFGKKHDGIKILDIGCGGGLLSVPFARLGADVTGLDASEKNIKIAEAYAKKHSIDVKYQCSTVEKLATGKQQYDVVFCMEVVEHVADVHLFLESACKLVKPGGLLFVSTLNRNLKSLALAKIGAEYILRWLPIGTHDWDKFLKPEEIEEVLEKSKVHTIDKTGMSFNPIGSKWSLSQDLSVNYILCTKKNG